MEDIMRLNTINPSTNSRKSSKRVGRGIGSGSGKTCGRGHKGLKSRSGGKVRAGFEGGQMPLQKRLPKFGFSSRVARNTQQVRLQELNLIPGDVADLESLKAADLIRESTTRVRVFLSGEIQKPMTARGIVLTAGAREAIEKAGGKVED